MGVEEVLIRLRRRTRRQFVESKSVRGSLFPASREQKFQPAMYARGVELVREGFTTRRLCLKFNTTKVQTVS